MPFILYSVHPIFTPLPSSSTMCMYVYNVFKNNSRVLLCLEYCLEDGLRYLKVKLYMYILYLVTLHMMETYFGQIAQSTSTLTSSIYIYTNEKVDIYEDIETV